jgi:hypothetical protein
VVIVSERYGFLFLSNPRTASTSLRRVLRPLGNVVWRAPSGLQHAGLTDVYRILGPDRVSPLFKWAVIRDPVTHLQSMYDYYRRPGFHGTPLSTEGVSFTEFYFGDRHAPLTIPQASRFVAPDGNFGLDLLLAFESIREGFSYVKFRLGLPNLILPVTNRSQGPRPQLPPEVVEHIRVRHAVDYECRERFAGRERVGDRFPPVLSPLPV